MMKKEFSRYADLLGRIDALWAGISKAHSTAIACAAGCSSCCGQVLEIMPVEFFTSGRLRKEFRLLR